ncbi:MAG: oligosaccharide flippase family protein [Bacteroidaceae bacterium]|nr:oligosaccharide flippase family protein [Bacteroidaceae bacterium]
MANLKGLLKDTAIYGASSILGRFLNYCLVPLYTYTLKSCADYGIYTDIYAQTGLLLVILTFGMETTFFRFINQQDTRTEKMKVYSTSLMMVGCVALLFALMVMVFLSPIARAEGYPEQKWYLGIMALVVAQDAIQAIIFAYLRNEHKPVRFACLKLTFIFLSVGLNIVAYVLMPRLNADWEISVKWAFCINLICTTTISLLLLKDVTGIRWIFDKTKAKAMLRYTWPMLILGIAGILNQVAGQIMLPRILEQEEGRHQLGIYEAGVKIAMIMALITQAFRYAYEPFVFGSAKDKGSKQMYAVAMKYFIVFTLFAYLCIVGYIDILQVIVGPKFREGFDVIPVVMLSEIMMGITVNLSFWYKLIDKTIYGAWFSIAGCVVLMIINMLLIPRMGYWACAIAGCAGYGTTMVLSYAVGQRKNPIDYPMKSIGLYCLLALVFFAGIQTVSNFFDNTWTRIGINTIIILIFLAIPVYEIIQKRK